MCLRVSCLFHHSPLRYLVSSGAYAEYWLHICKIDKMTDRVSVLWGIRNVEKLSSSSNRDTWPRAMLCLLQTMTTACHGRGRSRFEHTARSKIIVTHVDYRSEIGDPLLLPRQPLIKVSIHSIGSPTRNSFALDCEHRLPELATITFHDPRKKICE